MAVTTWLIAANNSLVIASTSTKSSADDRVTPTEIVSKNSLPW